MHEYGVTCKVIKIAEENAKQNNALKVTDIYLVVGDMSGFIGESIQMYFDVISQDSITNGAKLHIRVVRSELFCDTCQINFDRPKYSFECPICHQNGSPTQIGKEFFVEKIEIEV